VKHVSVPFKWVMARPTDDCIPDQIPGTFQLVFFHATATKKKLVYIGGGHCINLNLEWFWCWNCLLSGLVLMYIQKYISNFLADEQLNSC
jgi:hypothetical protein